MKKKIFLGVFALALLAAAGFGVNKSMSSDAQLSDLALANVEALAQENGGGETKGYPTSKKIINYFYDSNGRLIRTEEHVEPCCISGNFTCSYPPC